MSIKTYGDRPISFQLEENGEFYCIGSEVGNYLRLFRGSLYKKYPGLYRKFITVDERKKLVDMGLTQHILASNVSLLRANEIEVLISGNDDKFRSASLQTIVPSEILVSKDTKTPRKSAVHVPAMPTSSHMDPVPQSTAINRNRVITKRVRTFPMCANDSLSLHNTEPSSAEIAADNVEELFLHGAELENGMAQECLDEMSASPGSSSVPSPGLAAVSLPATVTVSAAASATADTAVADTPTSTGKRPRLAPGMSAFQTRVLEEWEAARAGPSQTRAMAFATYLGHRLEALTPRKRAEVELQILTVVNDAEFQTEHTE